MNAKLLVLLGLAALPGCAPVRDAAVAQPPNALPPVETDNPIGALIGGLGGDLAARDSIAVAMPMGAGGEITRFSQDLQERLLLEIQRQFPGTALQAWEPLPQDQRLDNSALAALKKERQVRRVVLTIYEPAGDHVKLTSYIVGDAGEKTAESTTDFWGPSRSLISLPPIGIDR